MTPEGKLKAKVKELLKKHDAYFHMPVTGGWGAATLDFLVCIKGQFIAIETKAPGKKATARQHLICEQIIAAGGKAWIIDDIGQLAIYLNSLHVARPCD